MRTRWLFPLLGGLALGPGCASPADSVDSLAKVEGDVDRGAEGAGRDLPSPIEDLGSDQVGGSDADTTGGPATDRGTDLGIDPGADPGTDPGNPPRDAGHDAGTTTCPPRTVPRDGACVWEHPVHTEPPRPLELSNDAGAWTEIPFTVVPGGARSLNLTTSWTYGCWTFEDPLAGAVHLPSDHCVLLSWADSFDHLPAEMPGSRDWRRNYNGIFTNHLIDVAGEQRVLGFGHGENKNEVFGGRRYQNTVNTDVPVESCASGYVDGAYEDCWPAYNAFVNTSWQVFDAAHGWGLRAYVDEGPVLWPANGYTYGGAKSSSGLRHPHGLVADGFVYVFYEDTSNGGGNRGYGAKVARAPVEGGGLPGTFETWCDGAWVPSLPEGFAKERMDEFYGRRGGCSSPVVPLDGSFVSFAAAHLDEGGYVSVEEALQAGRWVLRLRASSDLVSWSSPVEIRAVDGSWSEGDLHYPVFLSASGWSSYRVEAAGFYILGTRGTEVHAMWVALE